MRQGAKAVIASFIAGVVLVPGALAATPEDIYRDLADNGKLDGAYTQAELQAFLQSASVQGYGNPVVVTVPPAVTPPAGEQPAVTPAVAPATPAAPAPTSGVAGESKTVVNAPVSTRPWNVLGSFAVNVTVGVVVVTVAPTAGAVMVVSGGVTSDCVIVALATADRSDTVPIGPTSVTYRYTTCAPAGGVNDPVFVVKFVATRVHKDWSLFGSVLYRIA